MRHFLTLLFLLWLIITGCSKSADGFKTSDGSGKGGSLAKFTISGNFLYAVDGFTMFVYDITIPGTIRSEGELNIGFQAETIFPYGENLFVGSTDGMFIYSLENPAKPQKLGEARHLRSCDPVVANDSVSYVTLRSGTRCGPAEDGLYIYDISDLQAPTQKSFMPLKQPLGLGLKDTVLFVCMEDEGLTAVNVKDINQPKIMYTLTNASYKDVIPYGNLLICYTSDGLRLYDISDLNNIVHLDAETF